MGDLKMNSKSLGTSLGVVCLMAVMYFTGQWVGRQTLGDGEKENGHFLLNSEELSMLRKNEFLEVSKILNDPKTTNFPLPANYNSDPKYQGIQSETTEKTPLVAPPITKRDIIIKNGIIDVNMPPTKTPKTKEMV